MPRPYRGRAHPYELRWQILLTAQDIQCVPELLGNRNSLPLDNDLLPHLMFSHASKMEAPTGLAPARSWLKAKVLGSLH